MKHFLKDKSVYLCGSMYGDINDGQDWRTMISPKLSKMGIKISNPCNKKTNGSSEVGDDKKRFKKLIMEENWEGIKEVFWPIIRADLRMVDLANFVILNYDPDVPTIGTVHELVVSNFEKKVILLKYDKAKLDRFNPWMCVFIKNHHFFSEWDSMFEYLEEVDKGKKDTSLWVM